LNWRSLAPRSRLGLTVGDGDSKNCRLCRDNVPLTVMLRRAVSVFHQFVAADLAYRWNTENGGF
jgi:hypothetical protein